VHVCLVAGVPNDRVLGAVERAVEGKRQLHDPEVGGEMPAGFGRLFDEEGTDLGGELRKLCLIEAAEVCGRVDRLEDGHSVLTCLRTRRSWRCRGYSSPRSPPCRGADGARS